MRPFTYLRADNAAAVAPAVSQAMAQLAANLPPTEAPLQFLAGGTTLLDLMKLDVMRPQALLDIGPLHDAGGAGIEAIAEPDGGLRLGALTTMAEAAEHPLVVKDYPVIAESLQLAASAQLRNMASLGGNLLQRTRCMYFRDTRWTACNKRQPGSGCAALDGVNRQHAILGAGNDCIATYPGDLAQALVALDARVHTSGPAPGQRRSLPLAQLHKLPAGAPNVETVLMPGEMIAAITVPAGPWTRRSHYVKVRDRASYQFALASAAVALDLQGDTVRIARIALGGVATVPWRSREAEAALVGQRLDEASAKAAAQAAFAGARTRQHNAFKRELGQQTLVRALLEAGRMQV